MSAVSASSLLPLPQQRYARRGFLSSNLLICPCFPPFRSDSCDYMLHGRCVDVPKPQDVPHVYICAFCANTPNMRGGRMRYTGRNQSDGGGGGGGGMMGPPALTAASASSPLAHKSFRSFR